MPPTAEEAVSAVNQSDDLPAYLPIRHFLSPVPSSYSACFLNFRHCPLPPLTEPGCLRLSSVFLSDCLSVSQSDYLSACLSNCPLPRPSSLLPPPSPQARADSSQSAAAELEERARIAKERLTAPVSFELPT